MLVSITSKGYNIVKNINYHPYSEGQVVCNIFWANDCVTIKSGILTVYLNNNEAKIFVPKGTMDQFRVNEIL